MQANLVQTMINRPESIEGNKQSFRAGQVFQGKVLKLFPNQTAEVQVGSQKVIAQLEVPLSAGERYWFQVQQGDGKVHLKVLTEGRGSGNTGNLEGLLKQFSIPETKTSIALLRFFLREQLPITKESLSEGANLIQGKAIAKDDLEAIKQMISRELPLTKATFEAVRSTINSPSIHRVLTAFSNELEAQASLTTIGTRIKQVLEPYLQSGKQKLTFQMLQEVVRSWSEGKDSTSSQQGLRALQQMGLLPNKDEHTILQQAAQRLAAYSDGKQQVQLPGMEQISKQVAALIAEGKSEDAPGLMKNWIGGLIKNDQLPHQTIKQLFQLLSPNLDSKTFDEAVSSLLSKEGIEANKALPKETSTALSTLLTNAGNEPVEEFKTWVKSATQALGFSHEFDSFDSVMNKGPDEGTKMENIKSLLLNLLNEEIPTKLKEQAEALLNRLTGIQLMSSSSEAAPVQQMVMQLPFTLMNKQTDLTIQWNGRKDSNGKIDPNYCRVLFYLELEHLNETMIDMQIQNRIMKITVINDHENIKSLSSPYLASLKENLQKLDYQLSNVSFQSQADRAMTKAKKTVISNPLNQSYNGVDIKI